MPEVTAATSPCARPSAATSSTAAPTIPSATSPRNQKLVNETCPKCDSAYLVEYANKEGTYLVCPNNREFLPKRRPKKGAARRRANRPECTYERKIGPPKPKEEPEALVMPDPEKTRAVAVA